MKKRKLRELLVKSSGLAAGQAADQVDAAVARIVRKLRLGQTVPLPGLGSFVPGPRPAFKFETGRGKASGPAAEKRRGRR